MIETSVRPVFRDGRSNPLTHKEVKLMERLSEKEFIFIFEKVLGPDEAWSEYCDYTLWCDLDEIDLNEEE